MRDFEITRNDPRADSSGAAAGCTPTQRLIDICRLVGADTYLSGAGGHKYLEQAEFEKAGIRLVFQDFRHPVYPQHSSTLHREAEIKCNSRDCHSRDVPAIASEAKLESGNQDISHPTGSSAKAKSLDSHFHGNDRTEKPTPENKTMPDSSLKQDPVFIPNLSALDGLFNCGGGTAGRKTLGLE